MPTHYIPKDQALVSFYSGARQIELHLVTQRAFYSKTFQSVAEAVSFAAAECKFLCGEDVQTVLDEGVQRWSKLVPVPDARTMQAKGFRLSDQ
ncbi:hypothetical protein [Terriglobus roseus]|uniref:hypothetical protein n=1 Tax=Terriglobus roseus TaxID=392734 RepID=UPI0005A301C3|nr:hypothetical protein [Terriglobus roseus]